LVIVLGGAAVGADRAEVVVAALASPWLFEARHHSHGVLGYDTDCTAPVQCMCDHWVLTCRAGIFVASTAKVDISLDAVEAGYV
jgi:hypothetical protein